MKKLFILFILCFNVIFSQAEKPLFYYGFFGAIDLNLYNADFNKFPNIANCCPKFTDGSGGGLSLGLLLEYPLDNNLSLSGRARYSILSGSLIKEQIIGNTEIRDSKFPYNTTNIVEAKSKFSIKTYLNSFHLEPILEYNIFDRINLYSGLSFGYLFTSEFDQSELLSSPDNVVFAETKSLTRNVKSSEAIPEINKIQIHLPIGISYEFRLGKKAILSPELFYYIPLTKLSSVDWSVAQLQFGAAFKLPVMPTIEKVKIKEQEFIRDTVVKSIANLNKQELKLIKQSSKFETFEKDDKIIELTTNYETYELSINKKTKLSADLKIIGLSKNGVRQENPTIVIEETETEEGFPLLPYVFFKDNDSDLLNTSMKLLDDKSKEQFNENKLNWNTIEIYSNLLNIVAKRMLDNPNSKLTITGTNSNLGNETGNKKLSEKRAISVKDYLVNIWKIDSKRLVIKSRNLPEVPSRNDRIDGQEENRRVELYSENNNITQPLSLKEIARSSNPPIVEIYPLVETDGEIKQWDLSINQQNEKLRTYSGTGSSEKLIWEVEKEPIPKLDKLVDFKFDVNDSYNNSEKINKSLKLEQLTIKKKRFEMKDDKKIERFSLILFDFDKSTLSENHRKILTEIKSRIKGNSKVAIWGYTDRMGEQNYNKELALRRTNEIQKLLNINPENIEIKNIGSDELLFDNNSPEGRSYCRTVRIIIETPIN